MRYLTFLLIALSLSACQSQLSPKEKLLQDTIAKLKIKADLRPVSEQEAYDFLNKYHLPQFDDVHRKIFIHPMRGVDFRKVFKQDSAWITREYLGDTLNGPNLQLSPSYITTFVRDVVWDKQKLNCTLIPMDPMIDAIDNSPHVMSGREADIFRKKFGMGYSLISYPQYNRHTHKMVVSEYRVDASWCGTGKYQNFWYKKTANGWERM